MKIVSFVLSLVSLVHGPIWCIVVQAQTDTTKQAVVITKNTDFAVGRSPEGIIFDGTNIWVANGQADTLTKLSATDGTTLGTFPVGNRPSALAFDGQNIWVSNRFSNNVQAITPSHFPTTLAF